MLLSTLPRKTEAVVANDMPALGERTCASHSAVETPTDTLGSHEGPFAVHNLRERVSMRFESRLMSLDLSQWSDSHEGALLAAG